MLVVDAQPLEVGSRRAECKPRQGHTPPWAALERLAHPAPGARVRIVAGGDQALRAVSDVHGVVAENQACQRLAGIGHDRRRRGSSRSCAQRLRRRPTPACTAKGQSGATSRPADVPSSTPEPSPRQISWSETEADLRGTSSFSSRSTPGRRFRMPTGAPGGGSTPGSEQWQGSRRRSNTRCGHSVGLTAQVAHTPEVRWR
jgi:hypothetical protein